MSGSEQVHNRFSPFILKIIEDYQKYGRIVNESSNIACLFFVLISKEYRRNLRLHSVIQNLSGAGKSTLADALVRPFKEVAKDDVIEISRFTGPALQRYGRFDGKILYHNQAFGDEPQTVLPLLSEGNLGLMVSEREENSNKYVTKIYNVEGMPSFLSTTTIQLNDQLVRRVVPRTCDESALQTRAILEAEAREFSEIDDESALEGKFPFVSSIIAKIKNARVDQTVDRVIIPYASLLEKRIPDNLEMRSNFKKFLKLIASVALVKSATYRGFYAVEQKPRPPLKAGLGMKVAIASEEDFQDAYAAGGKSFFQPLSAAQSLTLEYLGSRIKTNQLNAIEEYETVRTAEMVRALKLSRNYLSQITTALADMGLISKVQVEEGGRKYSEVQFLKPAIEIGDLDPGESSPEAWLEGKSYQKIEVEDPIWTPPT